MTSSKKASGEALEALHATLAEVLAERIKSGSATAADLGVARQFLKDNFINASPGEDDPLARLRDSLPFPSEAADEHDRFN